MTAYKCGLCGSVGNTSECIKCDSEVQTTYKLGVSAESVTENPARLEPSSGRSND